MRKTIAAAVVAASVTVGGVAGALLGAPGLAGATGTATGAADWVREALSGLVDDGTIDQEQADAVAAALDEARPEWGRHRIGGHLFVSTAAEALDLSEDELRTALREGRTIAEVAAERGIEVQAVVDAIVTARRELLDEAVAAGRLTQEQADEHLAGAEERAADAVNGELEVGRGGPGSRDGHRGGPGGDVGDADA